MLHWLAELLLTVPLRTLLLRQNVTIYLVWQLVYYELIVIRKKSKIETGERINSYSTMSKGKGPVANLLGKAPPKRREPAFMREYALCLQSTFDKILMVPRFGSSANSAAVRLHHHHNSKSRSET